MTEIVQIFPYTPTDGRPHHGLGVNPKTMELFWDKKKIVTEQRLALDWWVNAAIIIGGLSTAILALIGVLKYFCGGD
ncbi:MAG: hypothetical protein ACYSR9_13555 [Planctomycetota bacterium]|jgi:hypothetical protein